MRPIFLLLPATLLALACSTSAQTFPYPRDDAAPISSVQVRGPAKAVLLRPDQVREIAGFYAMSNGWSLKVRPATRYIDATIDTEKPLRLAAVSPDKFISGDGNVTMEFNLGEAGDEMRLSYVPAAGLAQVVVRSVPMAQR